MAITTIILDFIATKPLTTWAIFFIAPTLAYLIYNIFFHPCAHIKGPWYTTCSPLWLWYHIWAGDEPSSIHALHAKYGTILRVAPNEIDIADGAALNAIYVDKGGFRKSPCYTNFDIDGHPSIFSALDPAHRGTRARAVVSMFSPASIRKNGEQCIRQCVDLLVQRINHDAATKRPVNVLNLSRCLAVDAVTGYLFGKPYGGLTESPSAVGNGTKKLSASDFVDTFVAVGRFFLLPSHLFKILDATIPRLFPDPAVDTSMDLVKRFTDGVTEAANPEKDDTYQARLLAAGISPHETSAQCMDLMFAGTDSTAMNLATTMFELSRQPQSYDRLREEVLASDPDADPQILPYLRAVVKEGLRIAMANPTRLPRVVPQGGWTFKGTAFPQGTSVGCAVYSLHHNESVFPEPYAFRPERWMTGESKLTTDMDVMLRDSVPFGLGPRQCIARNLATAELFWAMRGIVVADCLKGARPVGDKIEIDEWFNSKVKGHKIELLWS